MKIESKKTCCDIIAPSVIKLLEDQLSHELNNMRMYQHFSIYFNSVSLVDLSKYYTHRASEEFEHYNSICTFLNDNVVTYKLVDVPKVEFEIENSIIPFEKTIQLEMETTKLLYDIYDDALENQDFITVQWLMDSKGLIKEQSEELRVSQHALEIAKMEMDWISKADAIFKLL